jgi:two-component system, sensor histidine kinase and response regulator
MSYPFTGHGKGGVRPMARILIADDDPDFGEIMRMILTSRGHEVQTASNGEMAVRLMHAQPPELLVLDVMMTDVLDGVNVVHQMHADAALAQIPIIMVSSIASSPMASVFPTDEYLPIDVWISKPVNPDELLAHVTRLLALHQKPRPE